MGFQAVDALFLRQQLAFVADLLPELLAARAQGVKRGLLCGQLWRQAGVFAVKQGGALRQLLQLAGQVEPLLPAAMFGQAGLPMLAQLRQAVVLQPAGQGMLGVVASLLACLTVLLGRVQRVLLGAERLVLLLEVLLLGVTLGLAAAHILAERLQAGLLVSPAHQLLAQLGMVGVCLPPAVKLLMLGVPALPLLAGLPGQGGGQLLRLPVRGALLLLAVRLFGLAFAQGGLAQRGLLAGTLPGLILWRNGFGGQAGLQLLPDPLRLLAGGLGLPPVLLGAGFVFGGLLQGVAPLLLLAQVGKAAL